MRRRKPDSDGGFLTCESDANPSRTRTPRAKKGLGQHFLHRRATAERIVRLLEIGPQDRVLEIGPGAGALSGLLRKARPACLLLLEKDGYWAAERQKAGDGQVALMDALRFDWRRITPERPWKIIGNLPYNVASPLLWDIACQAEGLQRAVCMVQKEVALRIVASPDTKKYGALSVWVQSFLQARLAFEVGAGAFTPPPKVDSAVVVFAPLPLAQRARRPEALAAVLKMCFQNRRKQLQRIFRMHNRENALPVLRELDIDPQSRPEHLAPKLFQELSARLY
ncbi:MAG: 16S rRNA (adenine(1518)-N(6)/adenine(1519)-N(6))-dimethyltransferase RsmA [Deltaproteobacteria bacterium]|jgi:16S rRNA (adenine1518-N6/adenine1519-N6)-dimethyltransferase|nr:16S rRNA (adenine(1518)-N(6)/adenine(1519)-N(6))-dimethyltransferase RsmA [Deltaproteobacteria bacterium]